METSFYVVTGSGKSGEKGELLSDHLHSPDCSSPAPQPVKGSIHRWQVTIQRYNPDLLSLRL